MRVIYLSNMAYNISDNFTSADPCFPCSTLKIKVAYTTTVIYSCILFTNLTTGQRFVERGQQQLYHWPTDVVVVDKISNSSHNVGVVATKIQRIECRTDQRSSPAARSQHGFRLFRRIFLRPEAERSALQNQPFDDLIARQRRVAIRQENGKWTDQRKQYDGGNL